ncbi:allantoicase [Egibacter rhizosphaerae]|uniref:Probable allantoicase n=1 Tax=Egibacter rhizosphaerae TaxID=1670831 RepID=A0A411YF65_9ACTN|nr:allantoicase [Egibacter rhizosphaerae]QBI19747.1 allantoicase [Egibacter rhizosphaerae]
MTDDAPPLPDLAARRLGGLVVDGSDDFFAPKERLLDPRPPRFDPDAYTERGKVMDGWESRRRRSGPDDWCIVRLGVPGVIETALVDTTHFTGNHPAAVTLEGCAVTGGTPGPDADWFPLLEHVPVSGDTAQRLPVETLRRVTHVRFTIHPDGGVARLRLHGQPLPDLVAAAWGGGRLDLAAATNGGHPLTTSDARFSSPENLIAPGLPHDMRDGWETRRRRGDLDAEDWAVLALATTGIVERVELDTTHFVGNYPARAAVDVAHAPELLPPAADGRALRPPPEEAWTEILAPRPLEAHQRHGFAVTDVPPATHLRLRINPDGGVARLRALGPVTEDGWRRAGLARLNALEPSRAEAALRACCASTTWARAVAARRPFTDPEALAEAADEAWWACGPDDWLEAFAAHPRIGERTRAPWSQAEQAGAASASDDTIAALEEGNRTYEEQFGHVFLIRAAGRSADEMLAQLRERLANDPETELRVAAGEQAEITRLRLDRLLVEGPPLADHADHDHRT